MHTLQAGIYNLAMTYQNNRFADRQQLNGELFSAWKSQIDADFGLYKSTRDGFDVLSAKQNQDAFNLYKSQRDSDDEIRKELSDLKAQVAINAAVRPYQDKLIQCEIDKAFTAGINYTDRKTCKAIYGEVCLPNTPVVTGYVGANQCGCPRVVTGLLQDLIYWRHRNRWWTNQVQLTFDKQEIGIKYVGFRSFQGNINY